MADMEFIWSLLSVGFAAMMGVVLVDLDTWFSHRDRSGAKNVNTNFNWTIALRRWVAAFTTGVVARLFNVPCRIAGVAASVIVAIVIDGLNFFKVKQSNKTATFSYVLAFQRWIVAATAAYSTPILESCD